MCNYNYEQWLAGHSTSKTMMEKLERSLIPYELFAHIPICNDRSAIHGIIEHCGNRYTYTVIYSYECIGHEVYDAVIDAEEISDPWQNPLMGYNRFKVVMKGSRILTIYSDHEDYFQKVIDMFEHADISGLYENRSAYVNNVLARYILLRLIESHYPGIQLLAGIRTEDDGIIPVMAANANRTLLFMYAFSKSRAIEIARHYDGIARNLTVVYFINQDFEREGNNEEFDTGDTHVISIRQFYNSLPLNVIEKRQIERQILLLVSLLYNEPLKWQADKIERVALNPPKQNELRLRKAKRDKKGKQLTKHRSPIPENTWYHRIYRTLLEDALNVLHDTPVKHADIFHFLCAATMVNAYVNYCNRHGVCSQRQVSRMFRAKQQIANVLVHLVETHNPNLTISVDDRGAVYANIRVDKRAYQFSYRGIDSDHLCRLRQYHLREGRYEGYSMQSIATALYQYSYLLRWKSLPE